MPCDLTLTDSLVRFDMVISEDCCMLPRENEVHTSRFRQYHNNVDLM